jgi:pimeloyl-ACP methyl ester carboxylesterase
LDPNPITEHRSRWGALAFVCVFALVAFWVAQHFRGGLLERGSRSALPGELQEVDCWFETADDARCAWLHPVIQNVARDTALPVVILSPAQRSARTASIYLAGGPGGPSYLFEEGIEGWREWMRRMGLDHDLVLYDTRGTGYALPKYECPEYVPMVRRQLAVPFETPAERLAASQEADAVVLRCAERVPMVDRAAALVSTRQHARDLLDLIVALKRDYGYRDVVLYGVSYGSRLAAWASSEAKTSQERVSRIVLDSYYPPGKDLYARTPLTWREVLADHSGHCDLAGNCDFSNDALGKKMAELVVSDPFDHDTVDIPPPSYASDEQTIKLRRDAINLINLLMHSLSSNSRPDELPLRIDEAIAGNWTEAWQELAQSYVEMTLDDYFGDLAYELTECADNGDIGEAAWAAMRSVDPRLAELFQSLQEASKYCERLGAKNSLLASRTNQTHSLVVAMHLDPVTPWRAAREALVDLPRANWRLLAGAGHGVADQDECGAAAIGAYMNSGSMLGFDACNVIDRRDVEGK